MVSASSSQPKYAEFFCGGGMVRAALGARWDCVLANDIDAMKCDVYRANWGAEGLVEGDIATLDDSHLTQAIDLYWASSPCQDFSLAGKGAGLSGARSGVFSDWAAKIKTACEAGFAPRIIAFENVVGLVKRRNGADFKRVLSTFADLGYRVGALEIDARHFVPQSRPRVFVIAIRRDLDVSALVSPEPTGVFHSRALQQFHRSAPRALRNNWMWLRLEAPAAPNVTLASLLDATPDTPWLSASAIRTLKAMMDPPSRDRIAAALAQPELTVGTLYKRGRPDAAGTVRQRAEVRFDGIAGCLRTPAGGSSRQTLLIAEDGRLKARLLSTREAARLMGLGEDFQMPERYNAAYKVAGDGVVVPIVKLLESQIFQPVLKAKRLSLAA